MTKRVEAVQVERSGFSITVPDGWWEFEIRPETRDNAIRRLMDERVRARPEMAEHRGVMERFLRREAAKAWDAGTAYIGCMAQTFAGDDVPVTATLTVTLLSPVAEDGSPLPSDPGAVAGRLTEIRPRQAGDPWRTVSVTEIAGVGRVARTKGVEDIRHPQDRRTMRVAMMQTFVPVPGSGQVALISGTTRNLELADSFFDVFDAVTSTFRFI
ncbi:hypothetical protein [Streptomyces carpaticus]|uniref:DUF1795 domain-containing protein n=1 Tax=Streptomyces carpaticus TaxID=285558 RepID=A0ABV4ZKN1_9ACTN